jgi:hypothetical protein
MSITSQQRTTAWRVKKMCDDGWRSSQRKFTTDAS